MHRNLCHFVRTFSKLYLKCLKISKYKEIKIVREIKRQDKHLSKATLQGIQQTSKIRTFIIPEMLCLIFVT